MSRGRALLTPRERRIIVEEDSGQDLQVTRNHVQMKFAELQDDVEILREHHPELYEQLQHIVCEGK